MQAPSPSGNGFKPEAVVLGPCLSYSAAALQLHLCHLVLPDSHSHLLLELLAYPQTWLILSDLGYFVQT